MKEFSNVIQFKILSSRNSFAVVTLTRFFYCFFESPSEEFIFQRGIKKDVARVNPSTKIPPLVQNQKFFKGENANARNAIVGIFHPRTTIFSRDLKDCYDVEDTSFRVKGCTRTWNFTPSLFIDASSFQHFFFFSLKNNTESSPLFEVENKNVAKHQQRSSLSFFSFLFFFFTNQWGWIEEELFRSSCFTSFSPFRWNGENSFEKSAGNLRRLLSQNFYSLLSSRFLLSRGKEAAKIQRCHETIVWNTKVYW